MCLLKNDKATEKFRKKNKNKKDVIVWKMYSVSSTYGDVCPPYMSLGGVIKPGLIKSNRKSIDHDQLDDYCNNLDDCDLKDMNCFINSGIHVLLSRAAARKMASEYPEDRVFRCTAKMEDLVAVGEFDGEVDNAVFMNITISEEDFEKGIKGRN